jgi:hypothetical protein
MLTVAAAFGRHVSTRPRQSSQVWVSFGSALERRDVMNRLSAAVCEHLEPLKHLSLKHWFFFVPFRFLRFQRRTLPLRCNQLKIEQEWKSFGIRKQFVKCDGSTCGRCELR